MEKMDCSDMYMNAINILLDCLLEILKCCYCSKYTVPPIYQCINGHNVCSRCVFELRACIVCRAKFAGVNETMKKISEVAMYPCRYASDGCIVKVPLTSKESHEADCDMAPFRCLFAGCQWNTCKIKYPDHLTTDHSTRTIWSNEIIYVPLDSSGNYEWVLRGPNIYFLIKFIVEIPHKVMGVMFHMETLDEAGKYQFNFRMKFTNKPRFCLMYSDKPQNIRLRNLLLENFPENYTVSLETAKRNSTLNNGNHVLPIQVNVLKNQS